MITARNLVKFWSWELDQNDPYNVTQLFRGFPRPKKDFRHAQKMICWRSARSKIHFFGGRHAQKLIFQSQHLEFLISFYIWLRSGGWARVSGRFLWVRNTINRIFQSLKFSENHIFGKSKFAIERRTGEAINGGVWGGSAPPGKYRFLMGSANCRRLTN